MGIKITKTCDYPDGPMEAPLDSVCGVDAEVRIEVMIGRKLFCGDVCQEHAGIVETRLTLIGIMPESVMVDGKRRGAHIAASGRSFSTAEARAWLVENGHLSSAHGRVSAELLARYGANH